jgi:hypothetical protein
MEISDFDSTFGGKITDLQTLKPCYFRKVCNKILHYCAIFLSEQRIQETNCELCYFVTVYGKVFNIARISIISRTFCYLPIIVFKDYKVSLIMQFNNKVS